MRQPNSPSPLARFTGICLCLLMPVITLPVPLNAVTLVWDPAQDQSGSGGAGTWDTLTFDWLSGGVDLSWVNADGNTADFQGPGGLVTLAANLTAGGLIFDAPGYTLAGNGSPQVLTLGSAGITVGSSGGTIKIGDSSLTLLLGAAESFINNSTGLLTLAGNISNGGNLLTLNNTSSGGMMSSGIISGTGGLTINSSGSGVVTLSGSNSYTGATNVQAGTLMLGNSYVLSSGSALTLANVAGATLDLNGFNQSVATLSGGGAQGGNVVLGNGAVLTIGGAFTSLVGGYSQSTNVSNPGSWNTYAGQLSGTGSLALTGGSVLYLTNNNNTYSGFTNVLGGTLVVSNMGQLGTSTTAVTVSGFNSSLAGGALVVQGGTTGINFTRNLDLGGYGISGANNSAGYALVNIGNNTFSGIITSAPNTETRVGSVAGTMTFSSSSTINIAGTLDLQVNGYGNFLVNGFVTGGSVGSLSFYRWSGGGLLGQVSLTNPYNNFLGLVEVTGSFLRVTSPGALGASVDVKSIESYNGSYELRVDPGNTDFSKKTIAYVNASGSPIIAARAVGGAGINQTITIGGASVNGVISPGFNESLTTGPLVTTFNGNDGYGVTIGAGGTIAYGFTASTGAGTNHSYTSNLNGLLTLNSSFLSQDTAATRTYTITANGDVLLTGNLLSSAGTVDQIWTKAGYGTLAIQGTASTNIGVFNITNGSVIVNALSALNVNTTTGTGSGGITFGSTTTNGILNYVGSAAGGAGETSNKAVMLSGTTGNAVIFANQQQTAANTSATALALTSSIAAPGAGAKTLYLEGYNNTGTAAVINQITGVIQDNAVLAANKTSLVKGGSGTWLYAPTASTYAAATVAAGATVATSGTTASGGTVLNFASTSGLAVGQLVTGTGIAAGSYISSMSATTVTLSAATTAAVASAASIVFGGESSSAATIPTISTSGSTASGSTTMTLASTTGLNVGMVVTASAGIPAGTAITAINSSTKTITLSAATTATIATSTALTFNGAVNTNVVTVTNAASLIVGQSVTGANVPAGTVITAIYGNNVVLNNTIATAIGAGSSLYFGSVGAAGVAQSFSGNVTVAGGTLQVQPTAGAGSAAAPLTSSNNLVFSTDALTGNGYAGGTFQMLGSAAAGTMTMTVGQLIPTAGQGNIITTASGGAPTLSFGNATPIGTRGVGAVLNFSAESGTAIQFTTTPFLSNGIMGLSATSKGFAFYTNPTTSAVDFATVSGAGPFVVAPYAGYVSGLPLSGSSSASTYWLSGGTVSTTAAETVNALKISGSNTTLTLGGTLTLGAASSIDGVLFDNSTGSATISASSPAFTLGGAASEIIVYTGGSNNANTLTISAAISSGAGALTKAGAGTLIISGANTFTGNLNIDKGTLQLAGASATLGVITTVGNITAVRQDATLDLNAAGAGNSVTIGALTGAGTITNSGGGSNTAATLNMGLYGVTTTASATFSGLLQDGTGVLNVTKNGSGVQYLNPLNGATSSTSATGQTLGSIGYNTYSGVTTIAQGTLAVTLLANYGGFSSIGTGSAQGNAASLVLGSSAGSTAGILQYIGQNNGSFLTSVQSPSVQTNRLFTLAGNGGFDSTGGYGNSAIGTGTGNNAAIWFTNTAPIAFSTAGAKTLTLQGASTGDNEIDIKLINNTIDSSALSVTKSGTGLWILGNVGNTYSGATTISQGTLRAQDAGSNLTSATTISNSSSDVVDLASTAGLAVGQTVSGAGIASGTTIVSILGPLQIRLSTASTVAGGTSLNFGSISSLSANSNLVLAGGVLETSGTFTRSLGTGPGQVQWLSGSSNGGFAASGSSLVVAIGGLDKPSTLIFGSATFTSGNLLLGSATALSDTTLLNPIDLNAGARTITVTDNATTAADIYTLAGVISGASGSSLTMSAPSGTMLLIYGANTYSGNTTISGTGAIAVQSIGASGLPSSSFGDSTGQLNLGTGTTAGAYLLYTGSGETVTRTINLNTTTGANTIDASGSGALNITKLVNLNSGAKTLTLTGESRDANTISATLADNGGALTVAKSNGGVWLLSGQNTFTGGVSVSDGFLGIPAGWSTISASSANPLGMSAGNLLTLGSTGGLFSLTSGGTTITSPVSFTGSSGVNVTFNGLNSIAFTGTTTFNLGAASSIFNNIGPGGTLTFGGPITWGSTNFGLTLGGTGSTIFNVGLPSAYTSTLTINTLGSVTFNASNAHTGGVAMTEGNVIVNAKNPFGATSGIFSFTGGTLSAGTLALTGGNAITNPVTLSGSAAVVSGSNSIEFAGVVGMAASRIWTNNLSSAATLILSGGISNTAASTLTLTGSGNTLISGAYVAGTGVNVLTYTGTGTLKMTAANTYTGATNLNNGTTELSGANGAFGGTSGIVVNPSATLTLDNSSTAAVANRLGNHPLTLTGGTFKFIGNSAGSNEGTLGASAGTLILGASGQDAITFTSNGGTTKLNFASLTANAGSTLNITTNAILGTSTNQVNFGSLLNTSAATVTGTTLTFASTTGLVAGQAVTGVGILNGTTIVSTTATTVTLSQAVAASGVSSASSINFGVPSFGATATTANALLPRITIGGSSWAAMGTSGLTTFTNFSTPSDVTLASLIATPTITLQVSSGTTNALYSAGAAPGGRILNALSINGSGLKVGVGADAATGLASDLSLTLSSGGILVNGGTSTLNATRIVLAPVNVTTTVNPSTTGTEAIIQVASGAALNLGGTLVGTLMTNQNLAGTNFFPNTASPVASVAIGGLTKGLSGNLNITARQFYTGATVLNGGTTTLSAGNNTLFDNGGALTVNYGATLDLNGTTQYVGNFTSSTGAAPGAGGTVTSTGGASLLLTNASTGTWAGSITGDNANPITFVRVSGLTTSMDSVNSYYGATIIMGGAVTLQDNATLSNTSSITVNYANLNLNSNVDLFFNNNDRVNDAAPITLNSGTIALTGRFNTYTSETLGALTAASGVSTLSAAIGSAGAYSNADLGFASISHAADAILNFAGATLGASGPNPRILVADSTSLGYSADTGVIGAWAIANSDTWAGYNPSLGIGAVGTVGYQGYAGGYMSGGTVTTITAVQGANVLSIYSGGTLNGFGAGNVTNLLNGIAGLNQVITLNAGGATTDYLRFAGVAENDLAFTSPDDVLNIIKGGLLHSNSTAGSTTIGTPAVRGVLTAGGTATSGTTELVVFNTASTVTSTGVAGTGTVINSNVVSVTSTNGLYAGMAVSGTGVPAGAYVTQILNGTQFSTNYNATSTSGAQTLTFASNMEVNSIIADNGLGNVTRLNKSGTGTLTLTAANTYTGGTVINQGVLNLAASTAGTIVIPAGGITIVGSPTGATATTLNVGTSTVNGVLTGIGGQIDSSNTLTILGKSTVNLAGAQTLYSLVFNNNGGEGSPTVTTATTIPASVLNLSGSSPITASSSNPANVSTISVASLGLAAGTNTITVNPIQIVGSTITQLTAALSITSPIAGIGTTGTGVGISKAGNGLLQLSGASTFDGGVNLTAGGIAIGASSTYVAGAVTSGPLGTGAFTVGAGAYLTSTSTTNVISNALVLGGNDLSYKGPNGLTLNGSVTLNSGNTTVNVDVPGTFLTLGGVVTDNGGAGGGTSGIIKNGLGTFALTSNNAFGGSITVNAGVLVLGGATGNTPQPLAGSSPGVTITSNGTLALENNGLSNSGLIVYQGLSITVNPSSNYANLFVGNAASVGVAVSGNGTGNAIKVPQLTMTGAQVLNLSSSNAYSIIFQNVTDTSGAPQFNVAAGMTAYVYTYSAGNKPVNVGQGSLYFPDIATLGTPTTFAINPIELSSYNGSNYYPLLIQAPSTAPSTKPTGYTAGGLNASFSSLGAAQGVLSVNVAGIGSSGAGTVSLPNDASMNNRASASTGAFTNGITTLQGLLQITTGGTYTFRSASDDASVLYIDGQLLLNDQGPHAGLTEASGSGQITLASGFHTITYTAYNATNSGSYRLLYSGADTTGNGVGNTVAGATGGFQSISSSNLFYASAAPSAANSYNFAAVIGNRYTLATGTSATIDTLATPFGAVIAPSTGTAMVLNNNSALNIVNGTNGAYGAGWVGVDGAISIGNGVVIATANTVSQGAGTLNLIGTITESGGGASNALFKAGTGSLILGGSNSSFTGDLVIQSGFVQLNNKAALSIGTTASLGGTLIRNINSPTTTLPTLATGSTTLTLAGTDTASNLSLQIGMAVSGTGIPVGTYITAISGTNITLSQAATTTASGTYYFNASGMLDLNGQSGVTGNVTINGSGALIPSASATPTAILAAGSSGALWNSSLTAASLSGTLTLGSNSTVGGNGDLTLNSIVGGGFTLTKQGTNTLILNASNGTQSFATSISLGTLKLANIGALGAAANVVTIASGGVFDLNGLAVTNANPLTITGTGYGGSGTITGFGTVSSLGALINTSTTAASYAGTVTLGGATSVGTNYVNTASGLGGTSFGDLTLAGQVTGSSTLTKVGSNTLKLTGITSASTLSGLTVALGKVVISGASTTVLGAASATVNAGPVSGLVPSNTLQLDYTGLGSTSVNRMNAHAITLNGGTLLLTANASTISAQNESLGANSVTIAGGFSVITLDVNASSTLELSTTSTGTITRAANTGTVLIRGAGLGSATALTAGKTNVVLNTAPTAIGQAGAAAAKNAAIIPWMIVDDTGSSGSGVSFAFNGSFGLRALAAGEMDTTFTASNNILLNTTTPLSAGAATLPYAGTAATAYTSTVINSLTFSTAVNPTLTINAGRNIGVDSGGILATVSATIGTVGGGFINASGSSSREMLIYTAGSSTVLTINAAVGGVIVPSPVGLTKSGEGSVILGAAQNSYTGQTRINLGTLKLAPPSPATNALFYIATTGPTISTLTSALNASALTVNAGGTLDLNGNSQTAGNFTSVGILPGTGGIVTNTSTTASTLTIASSAAADWAGQITGDTTHVVNFVKSGAFTLSMHDNNTYAGSTTVQESVLSLIDQGRLSGTSGVSVRNAVLLWNDTGIQAMSNRLASNVPLTLDGGAFQFISRSGTAGSASIGNLILTGAANELRLDVGLSAGAGAGIGSATLNITGALSRSIGATLNFYAGTGGMGDNPSVLFSTAPTLTNGIIGGWATVIGLDSNVASTTANAEFATYDPVTGVRALTAAMQTNSFATSTSTSNLRFGDTAIIVPTGGGTVNTLTWNGITAARALSFGAASDTLTLTSGGLLVGTNNFATTIGSTSIRGQLTAGTGQSELYLHVGANVLTVNSAIIDNGVSNGLNLVLDGMSQTTSTPTVTLAGANTYLGTTYANGLVVNLNNNSGAGNAITGDLIISGGNNNATDSMAIANAAVVNLASQQIADTATVTVRGGAQWALNGFNETIGSLVFNSQGGGTLGNGPIMQTGAGTLTLTGGITSTSLDDVRVVPAILGLLSLASSTTVMVDPVANAAVGVNGQVGLTINSNIVSSGSITKAGSGVLQFGGVSYASNTISFADGSSGEIILGAGSNYASTTIDLGYNGNILDMRGQSNLQVGTITGVAGSIIKNFSVATAGTLVTGDSTGGTFAGTFSNDYFSTGTTGGVLNVTKIGSGNWVLTGNSASVVGTLVVNAGTVTLSGATGKIGFTVDTLSQGGVLTLDNSGVAGNAVNDRLGGAVAISGTTRTLNFQGGTLNYKGNNNIAVSEALSTMTLVAGQSAFNLTPSTGAFGTKVNLVTLTAQSATNTGTLVISTTGILGGAAAGTGRVNVIATTPTLVGGIRPDIIGVDSTGTGLVTHDANGFRLLTSADTALGYFAPAGTYLGTATPAAIAASGGTISNAAATSNVFAGTSQNLNFYASTTINSLTLNSGGGVTSTGGGAAVNSVTGAATGSMLFNAAGTLNTLTLTSGAVVAKTGNVGFTGGALTQGAAGLIFHTLDTLNVNSYLVGTGVLVKADSGTLNLQKSSLITGATFVNAGELDLSAGANTLLVIPTATVPTLAALNINGGTVDLKGSNQAVASLTQTNGNALPGGAGTVTNTGTVATLFTNPTTSVTVFVGSIAGNITLDKSGANILVLNNADARNDSMLTNIRGGTLALKDSGTISNGGAMNVYFSALTLDNAGYSALASRTGASAINLTGGTLTFAAKQGTDALSIAGALNLNAGANIITENIFGSSANGTGAAVLTLASLTQSGTATVNFTVGAGTLGAAVLGMNGLAPASAASNSQILITSAPTLVNGIIGGWAVVGGTDFASYRSTMDPVTGALGVGGLGASLNSTTPFGGYSASLLTAGGATDNITTAASVGAVTSRTINSLRITAVSTVTQSTLGDTLALASGGLLTNGALSVIAGGRLTAGAATSTSSTLYNFANTTATITSGIANNNNGNLLSLVKTGASTTTLNVLPTVWTTATTTSSNVVTVGTGLSNTAGLAIGQVVSANVGQTAGSVIIGITDATHYTLSAAVVAGVSTAAGTQFSLPTAQVLTLANSNFTSNTITVPADSVIYPGMSVTLASAAAGGGALTTTTVASVSGTKVTLNGSFSTLPTSTATVLFGAITASTATSASVSTTSGSNVVTLATSTSGLYIGEVISGNANIPGGATITSITSPTSFTISAPANGTGDSVATTITTTSTAPAAQSLVTNTTSGSNAITVLSTPTLFIGQAVQGNGIPQGATITGISQGSGVTMVTLSQNATATGSANEYFGLQPVGLTVAGAMTASSATVTVDSTAGLVPGQSVNGAGIPPGTTVSSITDGTHFVLSVPALMSVTSAPLTIGAALNPTSGNITGLQASTTPGSAIVTVASTNGLYVGMPVTGNASIPANEYIAAITSATTFTLTTGTGVTAGTNVATTIGAPAIGGYSNSYSGPTVVSQGTLSLGSTTVGGIQVPGDLILNNAAVSETTNGQIASASNITFNGNAGVLTLVGNNTFSSLTFNGAGGAQAATNITGGIFVLNGTTNAITAVNDNYAGTPTLSNLTVWELAGLDRTITTSGQSPIDLILNNVIQNVMGGTTTPAGIIKAGTGSLVLGGASTFNGGVDLNAGTLILGASSTPSTAGVALVAGNTGPLGIGTLSIAGGTTLMSGGSIQTVSNNVVVNGDFTFGGLVASNGVILNGTVNLGSAMRTITVTSPQDVSTLGGAVSGTAGLTKAGDGVLVLSSTANGYSGPTIVSGGLLQLGAAGVIPDGSALSVGANGAFDINGKAETLGSLAGDTTTTGGMITNSVAGTSATLTIGGDSTSTTYAGILTDTKAGVATTGNLILIKTGTGVQTFTGANTYAGATTISAGSLQVQNTSSGTTFATLGNTRITVASGGSLMATVASGAPTTVINIGSTAAAGDGASVVLSAGGVLDMRDNNLGTFNIIEGNTFALTGLTVASTANLLFDIGSVAPVAGVYAGADKINVTKTAAITSGALITLNAVTGATGITTGIIPLITASGGFTGTGTNNFALAPTFTLSGAWGSKTYNVTLAGVQNTTTQTALSVSVVAPTTAYWSGALDGNWSTNNAGGVTNWRTDATSNVDTQATPGATTNVYFNTTTPVASFLTTSNLTTATSIASLNFTSAATGAVTLGNNGSNANTLTIGAGGITHSSSAGAGTLNLSVILGASQTWTNDSTNALSVNGSSITGAGMNLTVAGSGDTILGAAVQTVGGSVSKQDAGQLVFTAINTYSGATLVTGGNLQVGSGGAGSAASSAVTVSGMGSTATTVSAVSGTPITSSTVLSVTQLAAATLSGTGSVGSVTLGSLSTVGVLRPGDAGGTSPGTLTLNGALTVYSGSQIQLGITSSSNNASALDSGWDSSVTAAAYLGLHATAGADSAPDSIYTQWNTVSGAYSSLSFAGQTLSLGASAGGTPTILVQTAGTPSLARGDIFKLMDWSSIATGTAGSIGTPSGDSAFASANDLLLPDLGFGLNWDTSAFASYGIVVIVPEPGRLVLLLFGLAALFLRRRCAGRMDRGRDQGWW